MIDVGIMHGRLVPPFEGRFQAFPANKWREEFSYAKKAGLSHIEWIYEKPHENENPISTDAGIAEIQSLILETGVNISSICADYYMTEPLIGSDGNTNDAVVEHLRWLIGRANLLEITYIVLPFVDASSLKSKAQIDGLISLLISLAPEAKLANVELHLETDLNPHKFSALLKSVNSEFIKANFDMGNSASLGFDPNEELTLLAPFLGSVHVKDRVLGGGTVQLGTGNTDLETCFRLIKKTGFNRWFVLQVSRGHDGDEVTWAITNREYVERCMADIEMGE